MDCEICKKEPWSVVLSIRKADGKLNTLACLPCAMNSSAYCLLHGMPHLGFEDGTTACRACIREKVSELSLEEMDLMYGIIERSLPENEYEALEEAIETSAMLTRADEAEALYTFIVSKALRYRENPKDIFNQLLRGQSAAYLLT